MASALEQMALLEAGGAAQLGFWDWDILGRGPSLLLLTPCQAHFDPSLSLEAQARSAQMDRVSDRGPHDSSQMGHHEASVQVDWILSGLRVVSAVCTGTVCLALVAILEVADARPACPSLHMPTIRVSATKQMSQ